MSIPDISAEINAFRNAAYGEEVRSALISFANKLRGVITSELVTMEATWNEYQSGMDESFTTLETTWTNYKNTLDGEWDSYKDTMDGAWSRYQEDVESDLEKAFLEKTVLHSDDDLNNIVQSGSYTYGSSNHPLNAPSTKGGILIVMKDNTSWSLYQIVIESYGTVYTRLFFNNKWNPWHRLSTDEGNISRAIFDYDSIYSNNYYGSSSIFNEINIKNLLLKHINFSRTDDNKLEPTDSLNVCTLLIPPAPNIRVAWDTDKYEYTVFYYNELDQTLLNNREDTLWVSSSPVYAIQYHTKIDNVPIRFIGKFRKKDGTQFSDSDVDDLISSTSLSIQTKNLNSMIFDNKIDAPFDVYKNMWCTRNTDRTYFQYGINDTRTLVKLRDVLPYSKFTFDDSTFDISPQYTDRETHTLIYQLTGYWMTESPFIVDPTPFQSYDNVEVVVNIRKKDNSIFSDSDIDHLFRSSSYEIIRSSEIIENSNTYDLFMFMGQSNMAGRGITNASHPESYPTILPGAGFEYRAISDPTKLYSIEEPFGVNENTSTGIDDGSAKTGSMVTAFVNAYYQHTKHPVIAVSASKGGSAIASWQTGVTRSLLDDAMDRLQSCISYCANNGIVLRHKYVLWCQGEHEANLGETEEYYKQRFDSMAQVCFNNGIEKMFVVRIGKENSGDGSRYDYMIRIQSNLTKNNKNYIMASTDFASMYDRGLMKDAYHYFQEAYNEVGTYAGINVAEYVNTGKEPSMYDPLDDILYYSKIN